MQIVSGEVDRSTLKPGYYWVFLGSDPDADHEWETCAQAPARFSRYDDEGREWWFYINVEEETDCSPGSVIARLDSAP